MATPIKIEIIGDNSQLNSKLADTQSRFDKFAQGLVSVGKTLTASVTAPILAFGAASINAASDMQELTDLTQDAFGKNADAIIKWSDSLINSYGVGKDEALQFASVQKLVFDSLNVPAEQSTEMIKNLVTRAGDLASAFNTDVASATEAMGAAFRGEFDTIEKYGIQITAAQVETRAMAIAQKEGREEITAADKALATYQLIMERSSGVAGNFAKTQDSLANQTRIAKENFQRIQEELGARFLPIATKVGAKVIELLEDFRQLPKPVQDNIIKFAGLAAAIGPVLIVMGKMAQAFQTLKIAAGVTWLVNAIKQAGLATKAFTALRVVIVGLAGPWGIVAAAVIALGAALVQAYKKSETFRSIVNAAMKAVANATLEAMRVMVNAVTGALEGMLRIGARVASAMGMDALAQKLTTAADNVRTFRDNVNNRIDEMKKNVDIFFQGKDEVTPTINQIRTNIRNLQEEIYAQNPPGGDFTDPTEGGPRISGPGMTTGGLTPYDQGGVVGGPTGSPQIVLAHGGETIVPTHKPGITFEGMAMAVASGMQAAQSSGRTQNFGPINVISNDPDDMAYQLNERQRLRNLIGS